MVSMRYLSTGFTKYAFKFHEIKNFAQKICQSWFSRRKNHPLWWQIGLLIFWFSKIAFKEISRFKFYTLKKFDLLMDLVSKWTREKLKKLSFQRFVFWQGFSLYLFPPLGWGGFKFENWWTWPNYVDLYTSIIAISI